MEVTVKLPDGAIDVVDSGSWKLKKAGTDLTVEMHQRDLDHLNLMYPTNEHPPDTPLLVAQKALEGPLLGSEITSMTPLGKADPDVIY